MTTWIGVESRGETRDTSLVWHWWFWCGDFPSPSNHQDPQSLFFIISAIVLSLDSDVLLSSCGLTRLTLAGVGLAGGALVHGRLPSQVQVSQYQIWVFSHALDLDAKVFFLLTADVDYLHLVSRIAVSHDKGGHTGWTGWDWSLLCPIKVHNHQSPCAVLFWHRKKCVWQRLPTQRRQTKCWPLFMNIWKIT